MENELDRLSRDFLSGSEGKKISGKKADIERIAASADGERVRTMLEAGGFEDAVRRGDANALRASLEQVMKTESGARLVENLKALMEKK